MQTAVAIILAAGRSTRMPGERPKVLHEVCGQPMLAYVLQACWAAGIERTCVVVGYQKDKVIAAFTGDPRIQWVEQAEQLGTGHAVMMCENYLQGFNGHVVVVAGDMPLIRAQTIRRLIDVHEREAADVSLGTTRLEDPAGYGRIVRDARGNLMKIVEHQDCTDAERDIQEVNPSYYCFNAGKLFDALKRLTPDNAKGEYYITDAVQSIIASGSRSASLPDLPPEDALGVNTAQDLARVNELLCRRALKDTAI